MDLIKGFRETWAKSGGKWLIKKGEETSSSMLIDGKAAGEKK